MTDREHVLFVGAGLSRAFGYALTSEVLPGILHALRSKRLFDSVLENEATSLRFEFEGLMRAFMPSFTVTPADDLPAVTDVLSLIDQLIVSSQSASPEMMVDDLIRLRSLFELAICELLMHPTRPEVARETAPLLDQLGDWLVNQGTAGFPVTIITRTMTSCWRKPSVAE